MKGFLLLICFAAAPILLSAQPLLGVGVIKLGKTFTEIQKELSLNLHLVDESQGKRKGKGLLSGIPFGEGFDKYPNSVFRVENMSHFEYPYSSPAFKTFDTVADQAIYFIPKYSIASLELKNIYLLFRNDKLVFIDIFLTEGLLEALKNKYAPTEDIDIADTVICTYTYTGAKTNNIGYLQKVSWQSDKSFCQYLFQKEFTPDCKPFFTAYCRFYDFSFYTEQEEYKSRSMNRIADRLRENNKKLIDSL